MTTLNTVNQTNNNDQNLSYLARLKCHYLICLTPNLSLNRSNVILDKPYVILSARMFSLGQYLTEIAFCSTCSCTLNLEYVP